LYKAIRILRSTAKVSGWIFVWLESVDARTNHDHEGVDVIKNEAERRLQRLVGFYVNTQSG
jgi:hypothetical protein